MNIQCLGRGASMNEQCLASPIPRTMSHWHTHGIQMAYRWHTHSRECLSTGARRARPRAMSLGHSFICQVRDSFFCIHGSNRMLMNKKRLAPWMWHHVYLTRPINIARHTHPTRSCHSLTSALLHMLQMACIRIQLNAYASRTPRMNESRRLHILAKVTFGFKLMPID